LRAIFTLSAEKNRAVRTKELAAELKVSNASVVEMVNRLSKAGLLENEPYYGFSLTRRGVLEAFEVLRKHNLLERFLIERLGMLKGEAHAEAHRLEHVVSDEVLGRIDCLLKSPFYCPRNYRMPRRDHKIIALSDLTPGSKARIVFSKLKASKILERLNSMGLVPETEMEVVRKLKKGPIIINVRGSEIAIERDIASQFYIEK